VCVEGDKESVAQAVLTSTKERIPLLSQQCWPWNFYTTQIDLNSLCLIPMRTSYYHSLYVH